MKKRRIYRIGGPWKGDSSKGDPSNGEGSLLESAVVLKKRKRSRIRGFFVDLVTAPLNQILSQNLGVYYPFLVTFGLEK